MSRRKPSSRLASVAALMEPSAPTTCRSDELTLKNLGPSGMMLAGQPRGGSARGAEPTSIQEESPGGEHEVGHEADPPERAPSAAQPRRALADAHRREAGP